jgi:ribosomal subunit interface protein
MSASSPAATINISGQRMNIGDALRQRSQETVLDVARRHGMPLASATVTYSRDGSRKTTCKVMVRVGGKTMRAQGCQLHAQRALDGAITSLTSQLRRSQDRVIRAPQVRVDKTAFLESGLAGGMPPPMPIHATM